MSGFDRPEYTDTERTALVRAVPNGIRRVLDVGCHAGAFGQALKRSGVVEVWGVEPDAQAAKLAAQRIDHVVTDVFQASNPIPERYFDLVTFNDSLEHMADPAAALQLARTKLTPGGRVHCCVPNVRHVSNLEHLLFDKDWRYEDSGIRDRTHLRFFTRSSICRLFEDSGFKVVEVTGVNEDWWERRAYLRRLLFRLMPRFTEDMRHIQFLVIAEPADVLPGQRAPS